MFKQPYWIVVLYAVAMGVGNVLFKVAAMKSVERGGGFINSYAMNPYLVGAAFYYALLTLVWCWILSKMPLTSAYPIVALAFIATPLFATLFLHETVHAWYWVGTALIVAGVAVIGLRG